MAFLAEDFFFFEIQPSEKTLPPQIFAGPFFPPKKLSFGYVPAGRVKPNTIKMVFTAFLLDALKLCKKTM